MKKTAQPMQKTENTDVVATSPLAATGVEKMILVIRDKQVLLDRDLATLYGVETRRINEQVKRNIERFPENFCFQLHSDEIPDCLKSQFAILNGKGNMRGLHIKKMPFVFTEQGVAMLSSVLKSESAIRVNIAIMRAFVQLRHYMMGSAGVVNRLVRVEGKEVEQDRRLLEHDRKIDSLFEAMDRRETDLQKVMENFVDPSTYKHFLILNGHKLEADVAYTQIYGMAKKSLTIVDNYVDVKTLNLLRNAPKGIAIWIFSDLLGGSRMTDDMLADFRATRPDVPIDVKPALHKFHDRYIFVDFKAKGEKLYHCGASSKDAGNKITTIVQTPSREKAVSEFPLIDENLLKSRIHTIRGVKVMLDADLAEIYGYETKAFNRQVKNNIERFPEEFRFPLSRDEQENLRCKNCTSSWGGQRYLGVKMFL